MLLSQSSGVMNTQNNPSVMPLVDIFDDEKSYIYLVELPGVDSDHINLEVSPTDIIISVDIPPYKETASVVYKERGTGMYYRYLMTPTHVDSSNVSANYKNGVLEIKFPKQ